MRVCTISDCTAKLYFSCFDRIKNYTVSLVDWNVYHKNSIIWQYSRELVAYLLWWWFNWCIYYCGQIMVIMYG